MCSDGVVHAYGGTVRPKYAACYHNNSDRDHRDQQDETGHPPRIAARVQRGGGRCGTTSCPAWRNVCRMMHGLVARRRFGIIDLALLADFYWHCVASLDRPVHALIRPFVVLNMPAVFFLPFVYYTAIIYRHASLYPVIVLRLSPGTSAMFDNYFLTSPPLLANSVFVVTIV